MAMIAGDARQGTGMAGAIDSKLKNSMRGYKTRDSFKFVNAVAEAVVGYIAANAEVSISLTAGDLPVTVDSGIALETDLGQTVTGFPSATDEDGVGRTTETGSGSLTSDTMLAGSLS